MLQFTKETSTKAKWENIHKKSSVKTRSTKSEKAFS